MTISTPLPKSFASDEKGTQPTYAYSVELQTQWATVGHTALVVKENGQVVDGIEIFPDNKGIGKWVKQAGATAMRFEQFKHFPKGKNILEAKKDLNFTDAVEFELTADQYAHLRERTAYYKENGKTYNMLGIGDDDNCTRFCVRVLEEIGIDVRDLLPTLTLSTKGMKPTTLARAIHRLTYCPEAQEIDVAGRHLLELHTTLTGKEQNTQVNATLWSRPVPSLADRVCHREAGDHTR